MQRLPRSIVMFLVGAMLLAAAGCGGGDDARPTTTAIGGPGSQQGQSTGQEPANTGKSTGQAESDPLHPVVVMETSLGDITLRLDAEKAPLTVDNFLAYVERGHYDQTIFHRVCKDYPQVVIGGAFDQDLTEKPALTSVRNEAHNGLQNSRGTIAMARDPNVIDSATCYFFFNVSDNHELLDHKDRTLTGYGYCVFGQIIEGLDVLDKIAAVEVCDKPDFEQVPTETVLIRKIRTLR